MYSNITKLGLIVDVKLKKLKWLEDDTDFEKLPEELAQEEEFNKLKDQFGL